MFEHDPDEMYEENEAIEEIAIDLKNNDVGPDIDDSYIEEAFISGAIFGLGVEEGQGTMGVPDSLSESSERKIKAMPLTNRGKSAKDRMRPFESWVDDVIHKRKTIDDPLD